jgi:anti-sigma B factor antagonist
MDQKDNVEITLAGTAAIIAFTAPSITDAQMIAAASKRIREALGTSHPSRVVFDFGGVTFFSSQVLGLLLETRARLTTTGGKVVVSAVSPSLSRVFKITNLDKIFEFYPDKEAAVQAAQTPGAAPR